MGGKVTFTDTEKEIWYRCWGQKQMGLSNPETWNAIDLIGKHLGVYPRLLEFGSSREPFNGLRFNDFEKHLRTTLDGQFGALYLAGDFQAATGCRAKNMTDWAYALGRQDWASTLKPVSRREADEHPFAPNFDPGDIVLNRMNHDELRGRNRKTRFLATEFVVFFLFAYPDWNDGVWHDMNVIWDKLGTRMLGLTSVALKKLRPVKPKPKNTTTPAADDIDAIIQDVQGPPVEPDRGQVQATITEVVDAVRKSGQVQASIADTVRKSRRYPKAAANLVAYRPETQNAPADEFPPAGTEEQTALESALDQITQEINAARKTEQDLAARRAVVLARIEALESASAARQAAKQQVFDHDTSITHPEVVGAYQTLYATLASGTRVYYTFGGDLGK